MSRPSRSGTRAGPQPKTQAPSDRWDPFRLPSGAFGFPVAVEHHERRSIRAVLPYFGIELDHYGETLVDRWDADASEFYLMAVRAIGAWVDYVIALPMPIRIPHGELEKPAGPTDPKFIEMQHHAYFEATLALGDCIAAGVAGYPRPALATLRSFVESSLAEIYVHGDDSGRRLWAYLRYLGGNGHRPRYRQMLDAIFAEPRFASIASFRGAIEALYGSVSSGAHVQTPDEALLLMRDANRVGATYPELVFWVSFLSIAVHRMLTLLVVRFPMTLFPVDVRRRFAFGGPMGLLSDSTTSASIRDGLGSRHADALRSLLRSDQEVRSLLEYYESQPELTDQEIQEDWERSRSAHPGPDIKVEPSDRERWAIHKSEMGALQWALDMELAKRLVPPEPDIDPEDLLRRSILAVELRRHYDPQT
jgi:hypothetical protein